MSLFEQDPAEAFLLQATQVLCSPPRMKWPERPDPRQAGPSNGFPSTTATSLIPPTLVSRDRKLSRSDRQEPVARPSFIGTSSSNPALHGAFDYNNDPIDRIPSPEESEEWKRRKLAAAKLKRQEEFQRAQARGEVFDLDAQPSTVKGKEADNSGLDDSDEDEANEEMCVICLQGVRDRTVLGECGHQCFCFSCINVWANQSRKCPLCTAAMSPFLLHKLDSSAGPQKFHLPPLPSIRPSSHTTFSSTLATRPPVPPFRQSGPEVLVSDRSTVHPSREGYVWGRRRERPDGEDDLERQIEKRRVIYRYGFFAKHIASNMHTRFKPIPTPRQFAENPELIARATSFLRRELRVWRGIDVEFLTAYIVSLMKSIDIRSEPAVRLLADFLDEPGLTGRDRRGAEHFAHEVYSFLRSPYRDLTVYDAVAQYDPIPQEQEASSKVRSSNERRRSSAVPGPNNQEEMDVRPSDKSANLPSPSRSPSPIRGRSRSLPYSDYSRSPSPYSRDSRSRSRSQSPLRTRPPPSSPRKWDRRDSYIAPVSPRPDERRWDEKDTWVDPEVEATRLRLTERRRAAHRAKIEKRREAAEHRQEEKLEKMHREKKTVQHRGLRGWGEAEDAPKDLQSAVVAEPSAAEVVTGPAASSLSLRIFGRAAHRRSRTPEGLLASAVGGHSPRNQDTYEEDPWSVDPAINVSLEEDSIPAKDADVRDKARQREKLLGKLLREKRISARARAIVTGTAIGNADDVIVEDRIVATHNSMATLPTPQLDKDTFEARAKAKLKLKLKLKLAKEKAALAETNGDAPKKLSNPQEANGMNKAAGEDRAAMLRAKLMASRKS